MRCRSLCTDLRRVRCKEMVVCVRRTMAMISTCRHDMRSGAGSKKRSRAGVAYPKAGVFAAGEGAGQDARGETAGERPWPALERRRTAAAAHERRQQRVQQAAVGHHVEHALQHVKRRDRADARVLCGYNVHFLPWSAHGRLSEVCMTPCVHECPVRAYTCTDIRHWQPEHLLHGNVSMTIDYTLHNNGYSLLEGRLLCLRMNGCGSSQRTRALTHPPAMHERSVSGASAGHRRTGGREVGRAALVGVHARLRRAAVGPRDGAGRERPEDRRSQEAGPYPLRAGPPQLGPACVPQQTADIGLSRTRCCTGDPFWVLRSARGLPPVTVTRPRLQCPPKETRQQLEHRLDPNRRRASTDMPVHARSLLGAQ